MTSLWEKTQYVFMALIIIGALMVAGNIIYELHLPKCDVCQEPLRTKGTCMLELYVCDDCFDQALFFVRIEQNKFMEPPYEYMDHEIWQGAYELLKERASSTQSRKSQSGY